MVPHSKDQRTWRVDRPHFLGQIINDVALDTHDGRTMRSASKTGHLGTSAVS